MQEAQRLGPLCPGVHEEDREAPVEGDGVGLLQLEGERGAGVPQEWGNCGGRGNAAPSTVVNPPIVGGKSV